MKPLLALLLPALLVAFACEDTSPPIPCREIPPNGCPSSTADACSDPTCLNVYDCVDGVWKFDHVCPPKDGGAMIDATQGPPLDATAFDAPPGAFGGPGCADLQMPDCPVGTALECTSAACCGCEDLFVCSGGGWAPWGTCSAEGGVQPVGGG
jgi:hypothetical protein